MPTAHLTRPHYENELIVSRENVPLSTVGSERTQWYLDRNLAEIIPWPDSRYKRVVRLRFTHKGNRQPDASDLIHMKNHCVVCGKEDSLSLHHVVPYSVKRHYPRHEKEHSRHQCVLLCEDHHKLIEKMNLEISTPSRSFSNALLRVIHKVAGRLFSIMSRWEIHLWIWRHGGTKTINRRYIDHFMKLAPKHLPEGWLKP